MTENNLKAEMAKFNIGITALSEAIGITRQCLYNKISGKTDWRLTEMVKIYQFFNQYENIELDLLFANYIERALNEN